MKQPMSKVALGDLNRILIVFSVTLIIYANPALSQLENNEFGEVRPTPVLKNNQQDVATVLVADINNRAAHGRYLNIKPEIGLLKSTARTFIQDGIKTEYVTKVIGTTIDNGQYVQLLTTTSRVLYNSPDNLQTKTVNQNSIDQNDDASFLNSPPSSPFLHNVDSFLPSNPYLVFPIRKNTEVVFNVDNTNDNENEESEIKLSKAEKLVEAPVRADIPQPNKVVPEANLPTYTVSHDGPIFHAAAAPVASGPRVGKVISYEQEVKSENENKIFPSVTYFGFADFTTTVGDTVIIFSPSTAKPQIDANIITSIKGEPTLNIKPTATKEQHITIETTTTSEAPVVIKEEQRFTPEIVQSALPTLPTSPKYVELSRPTTEKPIDTTTEQIESSTEEDDEDDDDEEDEETTPLPPSVKPIIRIVGVTTPESVESSQTSSIVAPSYSKPSDEDVLKILASLNQKEAAESSDKKSTDSSSKVVESSEIIKSPVVAKTQESETKIFTGSSIIFFDDITTAQAPTTIESDEDDEDEITTSAPVTTTTENGNLLVVNPLTPKPKVESGDKLEVEVQASECVTTSFQTLTYKTTFYIPVDEVITTTSVKSNKVVTSTVVPIDCAIKPTAVNQKSNIEASALPTTTEATDEEEEEEENERENENSRRLTTTTESSTKSSTATTLPVKETTTTLDNDENETTTESSQQNAPVFTPETTTMEIVTESSNIDEETTVENAEEDDIEVIYKTLYTTYTYLTTFFQESTTSVSSRKDVVTNIVTSTINANDFASLFSKLEPTTKVEEIKPTEVSDVGIGRPTEKFDIPINDDFIGVNLLLDNEKVDYTPALSDDDVINSEIKTLYTTYTYFTTLFNEGQSEVASRTEVYTNIINPTASLSNVLQKDVLETKYVYDAEKDNNQLNAEDNKKEAKKLKLQGVIEGNEIKANDEKSYSTMIRSGSDLQPSGVEEADWDDVKSSSSDGERSFVEKIDRRNWNYEVDDQISSESNTEEGIPSPTLLLQTRYTTFTYYTTVFAGDSSSNILSRLETLTNVVTETLSPTQVQKLDDATVPVTYFTTFTYWTTFYKDGDTKTTSREETVSNVVAPSATVEVEKSLTTKSVATEESSSTSSDILLVAPLSTSTEELKISTTSTESTAEASSSSASSAETPSSSSSSTSILSSSSSVATDNVVEATPALEQSTDPSTYFTTYTYYTTNYVGDETVIMSRFETETNVVTPSVVLDSKQGKAIDVGGKGNSFDFDDKSNKEKVAQKENVATIEATPALEKKLLPTGVVSINHGKIIDADGISTTHFTTQAIGTYIDSLYAEVLETSSSVEIDEIRKSLQPTETESAATKQHKTGLVRLIDGTIVNKNATTLYESKVIGTFIDGRYAQVIESTSSIILAKAIQPSAVDERVNIEPTAVSGNVVSPSDDIISPTPAVLEGSISESASKDAEEESEDDSKAKFPSKKKGFTPVIRPFGSSRSRPTFNPKKKNSGAAIVTPSEIIPTIRATSVKTAEASSRRPFAGGPRRSSGSVAGFSPSSSSAAPSFGGSSSRRSFVRPTSVRASIQPTASIRPSKASASAKISPTSTFGGPRRPPLRSSLVISSRAQSSSILPSINRSRIRPSATLNQIGTQVTTTTPEPDEFETTLITDEPSEDGENENGESIATTTENSRRRANPLLGRRPAFTGARANSGATSRPSVTITTRRSPLARTSRVTTTSTTTTVPPRTTRNRSLLRPSLPPVVINQNRQRPSSSNLFPPRGLLQKTTTQAPQEIDDEVGENHSAEDYVEYEDTNIKEVKANAPKSRSKRQTNYGTRSPGYNSRFKRPTTSRNSRADYYTYDSEELIVTETPKTRATSRSKNYNPRAKTSERTKETSQRIKPTTSSSQNNRLLFTLRDKDTNPSVTPRASNFRRPAVQGYNNNRKTTLTTRQSASKFRNYGSETYASPRIGTNSRRTTNRNRATTRGTSRSRSEIDTAFLPKFDGTITVTHHIPTEVTIPVVVGKNTEYKNVITAKPSTEILGPKQYSTSVGNNGATTLVILEEKTVVNPNGQTEITQYLLSETPTTSVTFTPTTIRGRKTSFSHVIPSTVYDAHPVVSTVQPQGLSNNAPLANILLSQLLLGNIGFNQQQQQAFNPLLGIQQPQQQQQNFQQQMPATPVTEFKTRTTTYVTTIHEGKSTVLPITFRGSKIYTTIHDESSTVITATEFITDTVVITPTQVQFQQQPQLNSLLLPLLLQQQNQQQQQQQQQINPLQNINTLPNSFDILNREALESLSLGDDKQIQSVTKDELQQNSKEEDYEVEEVTVKPAKKLFKNKALPPTPPPEPEKKFDTSVITLYVSGRRPGEFSTVLSTVVTENSVYKRSAHDDAEVKPSDLPNMDALEAEASDNYFEYVLVGSSNDINAEPRQNNQETESLDFVLGDFNKYTSSVLL